MKKYFNSVSRLLKKELSQSTFLKKLSSRKRRELKAPYWIKFAFDGDVSQTFSDTLKNSFKKVAKFSVQNRLILSFLIGTLPAILLVGVQNSSKITPMDPFKYIQSDAQSAKNLAHDTLVISLPAKKYSYISPRKAESIYEIIQHKLDYNKIPLFSLPVKDGIFTSGYGFRWGGFHGGIDIANNVGTPILSVEDGTVIDAGPAAGFGLWVRIKHYDGTITVYGHVNTVAVTAGQKVLAGEEIATMGNRGFSTGPHLHFEVWINDGTLRTDPIPWLASHGMYVY